jgi:hypothetical protein
MSEQQTRAVRQGVGPIPELPRTRDQVLALRFPKFTARLLRGAWRVYSLLSPQSRFRRWFVRAYVRRGIAVLNRRDVELLRVYAHPEIKAINTAELVSLGGFERETQGLEDFLAAEGRWEGQWERFRYEPSEVIDFGDGRFLLLGHVHAEGGASGVAVDSEWGLLATVSDGLVIREENFLSRAEALAAAGVTA